LLSIPGTEALSPVVKYVIAFAIIFLLLVLFALVLRRLTGGRLSLPSHDRGRSRQPRLGIVDVYDLDRQRQLILLRRDNVEHLLLIGGPNDVIVETNIVRTPGARLPPPPTDQNADRPESFDRALEASGRPQIEAQRAEPVIARFGATDSARAVADQPLRNGPVAVAVEPILKPDVVTLSPPPAAPRPAPHAQRDLAPPREPPPLQAMREPAPMQPREPAAPVPVQRGAPVRQPPPFQPEQPVLRAVPEPQRQPAPPPARGDATGADAAVLSNMAKQLEEALKRPLSTGKPMPAAPHPNGPAQPDDRAPRGFPPPSGRPPQPAPPPSSAPAPVPATKAAEAAEAAARSRAAPVTRMRPEPEAPPAPQPGPAEPQSDPFSVEEIEAEFARLLGRPIDRGERTH
jgi:flagellar protein FliO/FliZ